MYKDESLSKNKTRMFKPEIDSIQKQPHKNISTEKITQKMFMITMQKKNKPELKTIETHET